MAVELVKTVSGVGMGHRNDDDDSDESEGDSGSDDESDYTSSSSGSGGGDGDSDMGDEEDECTSGPEGAQQYREMEQPQVPQQPQQDNSSANGTAGMTEMVIEEELPTAHATTTSAAGARWFSARRTALDSVSSVVATGFRGRYAAAGASSKTTPMLPLGILPHPSPQTANANASTTAATSPPGGDANGTGSAQIPTTTTADPYADQVERIQGLHQPELDDLLTTLRPGQYPLLLGRGMLGVNLRQTYGADQNFGAAAATAGRTPSGGPAPAATGCTSTPSCPEATPIGPGWSTSAIGSSGWGPTVWCGGRLGTCRSALRR